MSSQTNTYIGYGVMIPFQSSEDHEFLDAYKDSAYKVDDVNKKDGLTVVSDGIGGKYTFIGHVIAKSGNYEGLGRHMIPDAPQEYAIPTAKILTQLGIAITDEVRIGWHVFTHYR